MKHRIFLFAFAVCVIHSVVAQEPNDRGSNRSDRERVSQINFVEKYHYTTKATELNLKGKIKSVRGDENKAIKKGNTVEMIADDKTAEEYYSFEHTLTTFSETGDEMSSTSFNKDGSVDYSKEFSYSKLGLVSQQLNFDGKHELKSKVTYEYDDKDYQVTETTFDSTGKLIYQDTLIYTFTSNNSYEKQYIENGKVNPDIFTYTYNKDTLLTDEGKISAAGGYNTWYVVYEYDNARHVIKETNKSSKAKEGEDPKVVGYKTDIISTYEYDANGNRIKKSSEIIFGGQSSFITESYQYTYDSKGNWIKKITSITNSLYPGDDKYTINERQLKYY